MKSWLGGRRNITQIATDDTDATDATDPKPLVPWLLPLPAPLFVIQEGSAFAFASSCQLNSSKLSAPESAFYPRLTPNSRTLNSQIPPSSPTAQKFLPKNHP
jgi:hypothetical protein